MSEWQDRRRFRRWFSSRWALVLFLLVAIFLTRAVWRAWWQSRTVTAERDAAKAELAELAARRAELTRELATLETERGQETLLRQKFPIAREGEGVIVVGGASGAAAVAPATSRRGGWWRGLRFWPFN